MRIEVWHNAETTDTARPWTVSLCDDFGAEEQLLCTRSEYEDAKRSAQIHAANKHLEAVFRESNGTTYAI